MMARRAETYPPETHVIDLAELRQIIFEMQGDREEEGKEQAKRVLVVRHQRR